MLANEFLTLAITETRPDKNEFTIVAMDLRSKNIGCFNLSKNEIISQSGDVFWDIGFVTAVENLTKCIDANGNQYYTAKGTKLLINKTNNLKSLLDALSSEPANFLNNSKEKFTVIKIVKLNNIKIRVDNTNYKKQIAKHSIEVFIKGIERYKNPIYILNKDHRWVTYWNWINDLGLFEEKKKKYLDLFNRQEKELYCILYRHYFKDNNHYWIAGIHWI